MSDALSKNNDCDSNGLDKQKEGVGDFVTSDPPKEERSKSSVKKKRDYPTKHGIFVDFRKVKIDGRTSLGKYMRTLRETLTRDLGGDLSTMEKVLLDRIVSKVIRCYLYEAGIFSDEKFGSRDFYLALCNSLRHDLAAIGLKKKTGKLLDLGEHLKQKGTKEP